MNMTAPEKIQFFINKLEEYNAYIEDMNQNKKQLYTEITTHGFNKKVIVEIVKQRRLEPDAVKDFYSTLKAYNDMIKHG